MSGTSVVRIGRKGLRKFAFGDEAPFEVDVVEVFQTWIGIDDAFRPLPDAEGDRPIPVEVMREYHGSAVRFASELSGCAVTTAEALDFLARLREQYDELAAFFLPRSRAEPDSPASSGVELQFSEEGS